jgi:hypothetical protein
LIAMVEETIGPTDNGAASPAAPAGSGFGSQPAASSPDDDLDSLLTRFDRETAQPREPRSNAAVEGPAADSETLPTVEQLTEELSRAQNELNSAHASKADAERLLHQAEAVAGQIQAAQLLQRNKADFDRIVGRANEMLSDHPNIPPDFAQRWLISESLMNPELRAAFDHAYDSAQARSVAEATVKKVLHRLRKEVAAQPDPNATEDVAAVTAAVRGTGGRVPEGKAPDFSRMSNNEFERKRKELYGF